MGSKTFWKGKSRRFAGASAGVLASLQGARECPGHGDSCKGLDVGVVDAQVSNMGLGGVWLGRASGRSQMFVAPSLSNSAGWAG